MVKSWESILSTPLRVGSLPQVTVFHTFSCLDLRKQGNEISGEKKSPDLPGQARSKYTSTRIGSCPGWEYDEGSGKGLGFKDRGSGSKSISLMRVLIGAKSQKKGFQILNSS
ncbi:hypothetical protein AVEN_203423-1 [Araneus ventricosus]|uniref:Uncharacterized protein n=1 Tax=Araneus ventricosus TaxID=182803 RepID=A0A4Y2RAZ1_ARAVE|nr:hypothetical protein AVEN_203423-1 [Araneus ventricosus]